MIQEKKEPIKNEVNNRKVKKINFKSETQAFNVNVTDPPPPTEEQRYSAGGFSRQFLG